VISVVIPTWNGERTLGPCLEAVLGQRLDEALEVLVIDSSSQDRSREIAARRGVRLVTIPQDEFDHGDTRNLGALLTRGELIAFLVQDARPTSERWLANLARNFADPRVAGVYGRVVPRPDAGFFARRAAQGDLAFATARVERRIESPQAYAALSPMQRRLFTDFNDIASCLRRDDWRRLPFARTPFGEDMIWARGVLEAGRAIVFEPEAVVEHSHEYGPAEVRRRTRIDAWWNRTYLDRMSVASASDAVSMTRRAVVADLAALRREGAGAVERAAVAMRSVAHHAAEYRGFLEGSRSAERRLTPCQVPEESLRVLLVLHGFLPETTAGTEVLTAGLAEALQARGHAVTVLCRSADPQAADLSLSEHRYEELRVLRLVNHLRAANLEETYRRPDVEAVFEKLLERERPDVVHFQHLLHLSSTLPAAARRAGAGVVMTLHDYWTRCPRVQLVRADGSVCAGPPPVLGCVACVRGDSVWIPLLSAASRPLAGWLRGLPRRQPGPPSWRTDAAALLRRPAAMNDALAQSHVVTVPSRFMRGKLVEAGLGGAGVVVVRNPVDERRLAGYERRARAGPLRVGFVGSLVRHKGLAVLASALTRLPEGAAEIHVHGDATSAAEFRDTADEARARAGSRSLRFHGAFPPAELGRVLSGFDVLAVPSVWYENAPLTILEALALRLPVVASDAGGMHELLEGERGGLLFRLGDANDLARVLRHLCEEEGLLDRLSAAAPPVTRMGAHAAEMEMRYRQAVGLARAEEA